LAFRADIQILRGVAVFSVFVFHLFPAAMPAGFLGVDIFFVVSGYLMRAIYDPSAPGHVGRFFLRRARRILPAYYIVLLAVIICASLIVLPHELADVIKHGAYSAALMPNIGYWLDGSYFDKAAFRPALNLWSMGVELQFYLIFPLIVAIQKKSPLVVACLAVASFVACAMIVEVRPRYGFYLTPFRIWEFMFGYYAYRLSPALPCEGKTASLINAVACLVVVLAMFMPIADTPHPQYHALAISAAVAAILAVGLPAWTSTSWLGRGLVLVGEYSYSIYLVHYPIIVFWLYQPFGSDYSQSVEFEDAVAITGLTGLAAVLLYRTVEVPMRRSASAGILLHTCGGLLALTVLVIASAGPLQRRVIPAEILALSDAWGDRGAERCGKFAILRASLDETCQLTTAVGPTFLLVGNSHADSIKDEMAAVAAETGVTLSFLRDNCVVGQGACSIQNLAQISAAQHVSTIIVHASPNLMNVDAIETLVRKGIERGFDVAVIDPVPVWAGSVLRALYDIAHGGEQPAWLMKTIKDYRLENRTYLERIATQSSPNLSRYQSSEYFCRPHCAFLSPGGASYYFDAGHLTRTGARVLRPAFLKIFSRPGRAARRRGSDLPRQ
jgi:peptidoglycan/LPS O-acetylase OafA/YrhL